MRVCIHPYSYRKRPNYILSRHPLFKDIFNLNEAKKQLEKSETEQSKTNEQITPLAKPQEADLILNKIQHDGLKEKMA
jgi:hypothetical protein